MNVEGRGPFASYIIMLCSLLLQFVASKQLSYSKKMRAMVNNESCYYVMALRSVLIGINEYLLARMIRSYMKESKEIEIRVKDCSKSFFLLFF